MHATLVNGQPVPAPDNVELPDGRIVTNPTPEILESLGYKEVMETDEPLYQPGFYYEYHYEETENQIVQVWQAVESMEIVGEAVADDDPFAYMSETEKILMGYYDE